MNGIIRRHAILDLAALGIVAMCFAGAASAEVGADVGLSSGSEALVSTGSSGAPYYQSAQDEPAIAVDPMHPNVVAAGANDAIDQPECNVGDDTVCQLESIGQAGVGQSGVYLSTDSGQSWTQPTYQGRTARDCVGVVGTSDDVCAARPGPIGTVPHYDEAGLWSLGDPAVAFGPVPGPHGFSWSNGTRLYYSDLTTNLPGSHAIKNTPGRPFPLAVAVSRIDGDPTTGLTNAAMADEDRWQAPVLASTQDSIQFSDKDQIWADNASSSPYFGNAYVCFGRYQFNQTGHYSEALEVATSGDGGDTWTSRKVTPAAIGAHAAVAERSGCTVRTDSHGVVYVFFVNLSTSPGGSGHAFVRSFDGGAHWTSPQVLFSAVDPCTVDTFGLCTVDGLGGARATLGNAPSISIANGAPTGAGATNVIVDTWVDGRDGQDHSHVMVASGDGSGHWTSPVAVEQGGDHGLYSAAAISPDGRDVYLAYMGFTTPYRYNTTDARQLVGQVLHATTANGVIGSFSAVHRGATGDPRGSSCPCFGEEFLGDYIYAAATDSYGIAAWTDVRNAADCPAVDAFRALGEDENGPRPAVMAGDCSPSFGNTDIYSWTSGP